MSIHTDINLDPDKTGVTLKEISHRHKLSQIRKYFVEQGFKVLRYATCDKGEEVSLETPEGARFTVIINKNYTWQLKPREQD